MSQLTGNGDCLCANHGCVRPNGQEEFSGLWSCWTTGGASPASGPAAAARKRVMPLCPRSEQDAASQVALPGGRVDEGETALEAALREMREEINVNLTSDHLMGTLDDYPTRSGYRITPFVFWADKEIKPKANPSEVAIIYKVPFRELAHPEAPEFASIPESDRPLIRLNIVNTQVHAPTAAVVYQFREVGIFGRNTRVEHLEQPVWAWS